jgi:uncharacterized protein (DUF1501 family)
VTGSLNRREFLGATAAAGAVVAGRGAFHSWADTRADTRTDAQLTKLSRPKALATTAGTLVLVTLYGGNDGLNTVIPIEDTAYAAARPALAYRPDETLALDQGLGLHPGLVGFKRLWDGGQLAIVRGVGYPNPNLSHFRSMDIWQSGVPDRSEVTGWLGRWLDHTGTDPLRALAVSSSVPRALAGATTSGSAIPTGSIRLPGNASLAEAFRLLEQPHEHEPFLQRRAAQSGKDLLRVQTVFARDLPATATNAAAGTGGNTLATQLDVVARAINAGLPTRVYAVSLNGFDTHAAQRATHDRLLGQLDEAITRFFGALGATHSQGVVALVYSEFGRRPSANASGGTDHGTAAPVFLIGPSVHGGFYGDQPSLTALDAGNLRVTTDFRAVYATVLGHVLQVDAGISLPKTIAPLPIM